MNIEVRRGSFKIFGGSVMLDLIFVGLIFSMVLFFSNSDHEDNIKDGKEFILGNASYKCTKTNELKSEVEGE